MKTRKINSFPTVVLGATNERASVDPEGNDVTAARLAAIVESSDDAIIGKDLSGVITSWNAGAKKIFGYSAGEMVGQPILRLIPPDRQQEEADIIERIRRGESIHHFETARLRKDGSLVEVSVTISAIKDSAGKIVGASKVARDIGAAKRSEDALKASFREIADLKTALDEHAIVAITDSRGKISFVNDKFCAISKYTREELLGQDHRIINSSHHPAEFIRDLWTTIARGKVWHGEIKNRAKDGSFYWVDTTIVPFLNEQNKPRQYVAIRADITERKLTEERLRTSLKEIGDLKAALDEHAIVAITDAQGKITFVNEKFCAISKYAREELLGQDHRIINSGYHPKEFIRDIWTTIARGKVWKGEIKNKAKDGTFYWVDTTIVPFLNDQGKPRQYVAIRADITERKRAEEVAARMHVIEEANRIKSEFLANMSHELRTPLNGIIGFGEVLLAGRPGPLNATQHDFLSDILKSGRHLLQLINDVLDLSKVEAGKMELKPETFQVDKAIEEVCAVSRGIAEKRRIAIQFRVEPGLGSVTLDQKKFKQVLYNLISNAVKFNNEGGQVDIIARSVGDRFEVQVKDCGIGIRETDLSRLFREFEQLDSGAARRYGGTGLGLALTKKIIEIQNGTIVVESKFGVGSTFTVVLPKTMNR